DWRTLIRRSVKIQLAVPVNVERTAGGGHAGHRLDLFRRQVRKAARVQILHGISFSYRQPAFDQNDALVGGVPVRPEDMTRGISREQLRGAGLRILAKY